MLRPARTRLWNASPLAALALVNALLVASCGREPVGAGAGARATLVFKATFQQVGNQTTPRPDDIVLVRINVYKVDPAAAVGSSSRRALIKTVSFDPDNAPNVVEDETSITFKVEFPLQGENAVYEVEGQALNAAGIVYYSVAPIRFTAKDINAQGGVTVTTTAAYVGPGSNAVRVVASPRSANLTPGQQFQFTATAFDANNAPIPGAILEWRSLDSSIVFIFGDDRSGLVGAQNKRGSAKVRVRVRDTDRLSDTVIVNVSLGAAQIQLVSGGNQSAPAGSPLASPIVVKMVASDGVPVPGVTVTFATGSGSVSPASATTASDGTAQTRWTLGSNVGQQTLNVSASGVPTLQVTATGTAASLSLVSGGGQSATAGATLSQPIVVQLSGTTPLSGVAVTFSPASGGVATPSSTSTDVNGRAQTSWRLGSAAGTQTMTVSANAPGGPTLTVSANATSVTRTVSIISLSPSAIVPGGSSTITVLVVDGNNQPVNGEVVTFSSSSSTTDSFNPPSATTGSNGQTTTVFTTSVAGTRTITARLSGGAQDTHTITVAVNNSATATSLVIVSGNNQTVKIGTDFGVPLVVKALNASGQPVAGAFVDFSSAAGNQREVTDANGLASHSYTLNGWIFGPGTFSIPVMLFPNSSVSVTFSYTATP